MDTTSSAGALDTLGNAAYISLETYKKSGDPVRTPVWVERMGDKLMVWTNKDSYKVKRLRRNPALRAAMCNANGKKIASEWFEGTAKEVEDPGVAERVVAALRKKYGWQFRLISMFLRVRRMYKTQTVLELSFPTS